MVDSTNSDPDLMNTIITGDESWVYRYDLETKSQSSQRKHSTSPRSRKARQVRSNIIVMLTVFFDSHGVVYHKYAPQGQTINVLHCLRDAVRHKRPELWSRRNWRLHHNNTPDSRAKLHFERGFLEMLSTMAAPLGEVCVVPRRLL